VRVTALALLVAALGLSSPVQAGETWAAVMCCSRHWRVGEHHYNQKNYGLALDHELANGDSLIVGGYKNSFSRTSSMAFYGVRVTEKRMGSVRATGNLLVGAVSGYGDSEEQRQHFGPAVLPQITFRGREAGVMVIGVPGLLMGLAIEMRLP